MSVIRERSSDGHSILTLIGWFSTCLLVAGWGPVLDPTTRNLWASAGLFGLLSAIILQRVQRSRSAEARLRLQVSAEQRMKRDLSSLIKQGDAASTVDAAVKEIIEKWEAETGISQESGPAERTPLYQPVMVTTPSSLWRRPSELGRFPMAAIVRHISRAAIGIEHDEPIKMGEVLLSFNLDDDRPRGLLIELLWWSQLPNGKYWSGGKILDVQDLPTKVELGTARASVTPGPQEESAPLKLTP